MKRIESLLKFASMMFEFLKLGNPLHKRQVSFLVVKTVMCKHGIRHTDLSNINQNYNKKKLKRSIPAVYLHRFKSL